MVIKLRKQAQVNKRYARKRSRINAGWNKTQTEPNPHPPKQRPRSGRWYDSSSEEEEEILPDEDMIDKELLYPGKVKNATDEGDSSDENDLENNDRREFDPDMLASTKLPVKIDGRLFERRVNEKQGREQDIENNAEQLADQEEKEKPAELSYAQRLALKRDQLLNLKTSVAETSLLIVQNPDENFGMLRTLQELLTDAIGEGDSASSIYKRKILLISMTEVFINIVPGYRIRLLTEKEKKGKVKKTTKELRTFEEVLVKRYQQLLQSLEYHLGQKKNKKSKMHVNLEVKEIAIRCLCKLVTELSHFNYFANIIRVLAPVLQFGLVQECEIVQRCFQDLLVGDKDMIASMEIVKAIANLVKKQSFVIKPQLISVFTDLQIEEVFRDPRDLPKPYEERYSSLSKRERKRMKETEKLRGDLAEQTITEKHTAMLKKNTAVMEQVFHCYFRVLRSHWSKRDLLRTVLDGLSKFAHLINVDFNDNLMDAFYMLLTSLEIQLSNHEKLQCLRTACKIHQNQLKSCFNVDVTRFYLYLYQHIDGFASDDSCADVFLGCLQEMLISRCRQMSKNCLFAFLKRLSTVALNCINEAMTTSLIYVADECSKRSAHNHDLIYLSDKGGVFDQINLQSDFIGAQHATLFESVLLKQSLNPKTVASADALLKPDQAPIRQQTEEFIEVYTKIDKKDLFSAFDHLDLNTCQPRKVKSKQRWSTKFVDPLLAQAHNQLTNAVETHVKFTS